MGNKVRERLFSAGVYEGVQKWDLFRKTHRLQGVNGQKYLEEVRFHMTGKQDAVASRSEAWESYAAISTMTASVFLQALLRRSSRGSAPCSSGTGPHGPVHTRPLPHLHSKTLKQEAPSDHKTEMLCRLLSEYALALFSSRLSVVCP